LRFFVESAMAFSVSQIDHVEVFVSDLDRSLQWYGNVLGLVEVRRWDPEPVLIGAGDTYLALFLARSGLPNIHGAKPIPPPYRWHRVAWRVTAEGLGEAIRHLQGHRIKLRGPVDHGGSVSIYFDDPDGNPLEITTYDAVDVERLPPV
jgi:catechol 2,3-dioxygenase-like lactoylglutathione lyase family enzyme